MIDALFDHPSATGERGNVKLQNKGLQEDIFPEGGLKLSSNTIANLELLSIFLLPKGTQRISQQSNLGHKIPVHTEGETIQ